MGLIDRLKKRCLPRQSPDTPPNRAQEAIELIDQGNLLEEDGNLAEALAYYQKASKLSPTLARAPLNIGNVALAKGEYEKAISAYRQALTLDPQYEGAYLNLGNTYLQTGRIEDAITAYKEALRQNPTFANALIALGYAQDERGDFEAAIDSYRKALEIDPNVAEIHCNLGRAFQTQGRLSEAVQSFHKAFELKPEYPEALKGWVQALRDQGKVEIALRELSEIVTKHPSSAQAHINLAIILSSLQRFDEAIEHYKTATSINSDQPNTYFGIATCFQAQGKFSEAAETLKNAIQIDQNYGDAYNELGNTLLRLEEAQEAVAIFKKLIEIQPDSPIAHSNLGNALHKLGQLQEAASCFRAAIKLDPNSAPAYNNLAGILNNIGQLDASIANYRKAVELEPNYPQAYTNLGTTLAQAGRPEEAVSAFQSALNINPQYVDAMVNLGTTYASLGKLDAAIETLRMATLSDPSHLEALGTLLFLHNYLNDLSPDALLQEAKRYGKTVSSKVAQRHTEWSNSIEPNRKIRIGLVSGDFCEHPVGFFLDKVISELGNRGHLELFAYSNHHVEDALTRRLKLSCKGWRSIMGLSDNAASDLIHTDKIDILIDLSGHTLRNRLPLFAWRAAPVQVTWLGYFATTGVSEIDYLIADPLTLPETLEKNFTETILRLPETRLCFSTPTEKVSVGGLPATTNGYITYGCFNNIAKLNNSVLSLWSELLRKQPDSKLCLMAPQFREAKSRENILNRFDTYGISSDRIILKIAVPRAQYLDTYNQIDIALDPFPYTGGTTTMEAIWMGVPVLTLAGNNFLSRQGLGLLTNAGLNDWVADSEEEYLQRAIEKSSDLPALANLRQKLRSQALASPVYDSGRFAANFEMLMQKIWTTWCVHQTHPSQPAGL